MLDTWNRYPKYPVNNLHSSFIFNVTRHSYACPRMWCTRYILVGFCPYVPQRLSFPYRLLSYWYLQYLVVTHAIAMWHYFVFFRFWHLLWSFTMGFVLEKQSLLDSDFYCRTLSRRTLGQESCLLSIFEISQRTAWMHFSLVTLYHPARKVSLTRYNLAHFKSNTWIFRHGQPYQWISSVESHMSWMASFWLMMMNGNADHWYVRSMSDEALNILI